MATYSTPGQLFKTLRAASGLTQPEVAVQAKVAVSTVSRLETDALVPKADILAAMMRAVHGRPEQLEQVGQDAAADLLRASLEMRVDGDGVSVQGPRSKALYTALIDATALLHASGWSVTTRQSDQPDVVVMELRPSSSTTDESEQTGKRLAG